MVLQLLFYRVQLLGFIKDGRQNYDVVPIQLFLQTPGGTTSTDTERPDSHMVDSVI